MRKKISLRAPSGLRARFEMGSGQDFPALVGLLLAALSSTSACAPSSGTIGAILAKQNDGSLVIHEAPEKLGADKAGLLPGDEVLLIAGHDVRPLSDAELHRLLQGPEGTTVRLTVLRRGEVLHVTVMRTKPPPRIKPTSTAKDPD